MNKNTFKKICKIGFGVIATTAAAFAAEAGPVNAATGKVALNVQSILNESSFIIKSGAVIAALWGGYKVLLSDGATGVHWFMLIIGGAIAAGYGVIGNVVVGFFDAT